MLWVCFCFLILTTKIFQFCFARIWKVDLFCFVVQVYDETNWNMLSRYFGAAVSSRAAGAEQKGCGCHMQDGGVPVGFCSFLLFLFFSPLSPLLASHSCWENIFTPVWVSRCCQVLTATKNPLKTRLLLPPTVGGQKPSLPIEQEGEIKDESAGQDQQFHLPR